MKNQNGCCFSTDRLNQIKETHYLPTLGRMGESPYNLLEQVNATLAQSYQPFVASRLEWVSNEVDRLWPVGIP